MKRTKFHRGFTLVEMMVVISIFVIITGVVLANVPSFRNRTSLDLVAEEVALTIRQAQVFGIGTRTFNAGAGDYPSYGVYFKPGAESQFFILFGDRLPLGNLDGKYTSGDFSCPAGGECLEKFALTGGVAVTDLKGCADEECQNPASLTEVNIIFQRGAGADAEFKTVPPATPALIKITLQSSAATETPREIIIWKTGHIYVYKP